MANHKSAEKRNRQAQAARLRNKMNRTKMKSIIRKLDEAVDAGTADVAKDVLVEATSVIARTASKGTIHKRNASRKISRLTKRVNKMTTAA
ncbi:MAG: 30S ribosomal protein S20 [Desulforhopalus sp.]|nr:30S ribosomal protein S20 [Desulforhopalus sp.]